MHKQCVLLQTLFHKKRFRQDPFEWVYEGLDPLNILAVLQTSKGISLTLAVLYVTIARQLGVPMSIMPAVEGNAHHMLYLRCLACTSAWCILLAAGDVM